MTTNPSQPAKSHGWFRFSLRSVLIVMTVLCLLIGFKAKQLRDRRASLAAIDAVGGASKIRIEGPEWFRKLIGDEKSFYNVGSVRLGPIDADYDTSLNFDDELAKIIPHLNSFSRFYKLNIAKSPVANEGLKHLRRLANLERLNLSDTGVSDSGLEILEDIKSLEWLFLKNTKVTPDGIAKLQQALPDCKIEY